MFVGICVRLNSFICGEVINGIVFGVFFYVILIFEMFGVKYILVVNVGFLIVLLVVLVFFFECFIGKRK